MLVAPRAAARRRPGQEFSARLHSLRHRHAEQAKAGGQHVMRERAEREPAGAERGRLRLQHRALLVERGEQAGHVEQVRAQAVRLALCALTLSVLSTGLGLLGVPVPDRM